jgi:sortase B
LNDSAFDGIRSLNPLPDYLELFRQNNDMVGYIRVGDSRVDYPVLQTDNNHFYLHRDFEGNTSRGGWIYADYRNRFEGVDISGNTILYGHNIDTGAYFSQLSRYYFTTTDGSLSFYKENPVFKFDTLYEKMEWKVFAVGLYNNKLEHGEVYPYFNKTEFEDEDDFHNFIFDIMDRSVLFTDVDLEYGDKIITLSTCYYPMGTTVDTRSVIFARRVRPGESNRVDVEKARCNHQVMRFSEEARRMGTQWTGERVWDTSYLLSYDG